ncbi:hypothetical protein [Paracoccus albicereus]|uniref:hypothetical protein n=1 Tax=Paracoccus albicereus TaxID=2922394 RepID=UPI0021017FD4|nr:hypothetical protein [Paracoccus albicereus]
MILTLAVMLSLILGFVWGMMWASRRWLHVNVALFIGFGTSLYFLQSILRGMVFCAKAPVFAPPEPGSGGEGQMIFNCDGAGGMLDRLYIYLLGPALILGCLLLVWHYWPRRSGEMTNS